MANTAVRCCFALIRWFPVVFIAAVIVWSYYAYVLQLCIFNVNSTAEKVLYLLFYHVVLGIFLWAYWQTIFTEPGEVPKRFFLSHSQIEAFDRALSEDEQLEQLEQIAAQLPVQTRTMGKAVRFCEKCKCVKPDRAHHCSVCGRCILKMDHHCPWVNNCVNYTNYKFFVLFLGYGLVYCLYVAATSAYYFVWFWTDIDRDMNNLHIVFLFFASCMFAISLVSLFCYHLYLTFTNRSTLESFRAPIFRDGPDKKGFYLGAVGNFQEVFGDNKCLWFLPVFTSLGDGVSYPLRPSRTGVSYNSMAPTEPQVVVVSAELQQQQQPSAADPTVQRQDTLSQSHNNSAFSFGDGVNFPSRHVSDDEHGLLNGSRAGLVDDGGLKGHQSSRRSHYS